MSERSAALPAAPRSSRLPSLTGLRFAAAFLVLACHLGTSMAPRMSAEHLGRYQRFFDAAGSAGVSFFFVLSGFVLTWAARPGDRPRAFWRRRLVKIFPNHLVTLAVALVLMATADIAVTRANTLPTVFLVQSWVPRQDVLLNYGSNTPSWSLACELFFYLAFPWLLAGLSRIRDGRLWGWVLGTTAAVFAVPAVAGLLPGRPYMPLTTDSWWVTWFTYYLPATRALEFVLGILLALVVLRGRWIRFGTAPAGLLFAAAFLGGAYLPGDYALVAPTVLPAALLIAARAAADRDGRRSLFAHPVAVRLGELSFAFYMVHFLVVSYGPLGAAHQANWAKPLAVHTAVADALLSLLLSLVFAWLLHHLVELPALRRWSRPAAARAAADVSAAAAGPVPALPVSEPEPGSARESVHQPDREPVLESDHEPVREPARSVVERSAPR